jgi:alkylation response protein AidB-like acyl-CoA dehydrogenase
MASIHGCIGAVDPVRTFGTPEHKQRFLPKLASGQAQSGFALTEPAAGSDLTALRTTARIDGDD